MVWRSADAYVHVDGRNPNWSPRCTGASAQRLNDQASFILTRTRTPGWEITDEEMIDHYRQQYHCEHGFAWLKSGAEINPMFIESPHRIASMGLISCVGLMTWAIIQRTVRAYLVANGSGLPSHRNKPSPNITIRFLSRPGKLLVPVQILSNRSCLHA